MPKTEQFARQLLTRVFCKGVDVDAEDIQEIAVKCGLLRREKFNPKRHTKVFGPRLAPGDTILVFAGELAADQQVQLS